MKRTTGNVLTGSTIGIRAGGSTNMKRENVSRFERSLWELGWWTGVRNLKAPNFFRGQSGMERGSDRNDKNLYSPGMVVVSRVSSAAADETRGALVLTPVRAARCVAAPRKDESGGAGD